MGIFSKVHFQPRILTRSSCQPWRMTLMLLQACITYGAQYSPDKAFTAAFKEDFKEWVAEYRKKADFNIFGIGAEKKETWIRKKLHDLINYDQNYLNMYPYKKPELQRIHVEARYLAFKENGRCVDKVDEWLKTFDKIENDTSLTKKKKNKKKFEHYKATLKHLLSEEDIINGWKKTSNICKEMYLENQFWEFFKLQGDPHCLVRLKDKQTIRARIEELQNDEESKKGYEAGKRDAAVLSGDGLGRKIKLMNALYDRFKDMKSHFWKLVDPEDKRLTDTSWTGADNGVLQVRLKHSKCEISGCKLKWFQIWKNFKKWERNCKTCGRILCDAHALELPYKALGIPKNGTRRSCRKGEGCLNKKEFEDFFGQLEEPRSSPVRESASYEDGYRLGYREGIQKRKETDEYRMKCILYKRFHEVADLKYEEDAFSDKYRFNRGAGIRDLKLKYDRCEIESCPNSCKPAKWYKLTKLNYWRSYRNCKACGRLICKSCKVEEKHEDENDEYKVKEDWYCKPGRGCRWHEPAKTLPADAPTESDPKSDRRMLGKINLSDSFWQGFFTSMLILLGTFVVYHLVFQKPSNHPCRKTYIKKKRSTFFKGRTSDVKSRTSVREAKGVFSKVIRRQLSKLDEN